MKELITEYTLFDVIQFLLKKILLPQIIMRKSKSLCK